MNENNGTRRLHVPGEPDPNIPTPRFLVVQDEKGLAQLPFTVMAMLSDSVRQDIYQIARQAALDAIKDGIVSVATVLLQAFTAPPEPAKTDEAQAGEPPAQQDNDAAEPVDVELPDERDPFAGEPVVPEPGSPEEEASL